MSAIPTRHQVSAGGVVYRHTDDEIEVALISVGQEPRWQLPKGLIGNDETPLEAALREVREETGLQTECVETLDTIEYWYVGTHQGQRFRYHKNVHYYLLRYLSGSTSDHDAEVNEARWFEIDDALQELAFKNERDILLQAQQQIDSHR